jgi:class 3 adenylate cyclase/YHS domain-containing protein
VRFFVYHDEGKAAVADRRWIGQSGAMAALGASESSEPAGAHAERTFVFIDLAGFTALTAAHGDDDAARVIDRFEAVVRSALSDDAEFVKSIGDEAMLAFAEIASALDAARAIFEQCVGAPGLPIPRGGAFHGVAVTRSGDYLGGCVNTAARIAAQARAGQFLVGDTVAKVARARGMSVTHLGDFMLRNLVEPVPIYEVHLVASDRYVIDPVCRMRVDVADAIGVRYQGMDYWLCSLACAERFRATPELYTTSV